MKTISLNGKWKCKPDIENLGIKYKWYLIENYDIDKNDLIDIEIPKSYNILKGYDNFEGIFWHFYQFNLSESLDNRNFDYQIRFKGANYNTKVWLNGSFLGVHNGGFTPFAFNMNKIIKAKNNFLVVRIENIRMSYRIPSLFFDWFNWGGIYRDIDLMILNKNRLEDVVIKTTLTTKKKVLLMFYIISLEIFH